MLRTLESIASSVYIFPRDETPNTIQPNIGVIKLYNQTILIDAGNSPRHARQITTAINENFLPPVRTIILTHHHWDHSFGLASFKARNIIAHEKTNAYLSDYKNRDWNAAGLRQEIKQNPKREISNNAMIDAIFDWRAFQIAKPTITFSKTLTLYLEEMVIELEHVGGIHADDSIVIRLPEQGVMFLGDSYYPKPYHLRDEGDEDLHLPLLEKFLADDYDIYIDGHGAPRTHAEFSKMIAWEKGRQGIK
ncbi:MAG: MBL fold metallo-hydrolase [Phototrophicaceae bacterium]